MVSGVEGPLEDVASGVPQGSVLGPLLFPIYVNHISSSLTCEWKAFADDFKLYLSYSRVDHESLRQGVLDLQGNVDRVAQVAGGGCLDLNVDKCFVMRFSRGKIDWDLDHGEGVFTLGGGQLSIVESHRDLGVVVDSKLKFHKHVRTVIGKAGWVLGEMLRSTMCRTPKFMVSLFVSHIRPILDYCSSVWNVGYLGDAEALEGVQRRWTREINGMDHLEYAQ